MNDVGLRLTREIKAADVFRATLADIAGDDQDLVRDMMEGETNLLKLIERADMQIVQDTALIEGTKAVIQQLEGRAVRVSKRIEYLRIACLTALQMSERTSLELPTGTLTRKATPAKALIVDDAQIPSQFWKPQDPVIDKKALLAALKEGQVPGAQLSNGGETLQIRR